MIALEARDKGLLGMTLRYPYEVRDSAEYFDDIRDVKITKDMLELAQHIVESKTGSFDPSKFEDRYEEALKDLLKRKQAGRPIKAVKHAAPTNVVNLMDALRRSIGAEKSPGRAASGRTAAKSRAPSKRSAARVRRAS